MAVVPIILQEIGKSGPAHRSCGAGDRNRTGNGLLGAEDGTRTRYLQSGNLSLDQLSFFRSF